VKGFQGPTAQAQAMESLKPWPKPWLLVPEFVIMSTERALQDRCPPNPSSCLTADSNATQPALAPHCVTIALAQARCAAEAQITPSTGDIAQLDHSPEQQDED
jgi:hypothetical protein